MATTLLTTRLLCRVIVTLRAVDESHVVLVRCPAHGTVNGFGVSLVVFPHLLD